MLLERRGMALEIDSVFWFDFSFMVEAPAVPP
jgi:hypothetical protein